MFLFIFGACEDHHVEAPRRRQDTRLSTEYQRAHVNACLRACVRARVCVLYTVLSFERLPLVHDLFNGLRGGVSAH